MPFVVNSQEAIKERVEYNDFKGTALELMNRICLLGEKSDRRELSWLCDAIIGKYGPVKSLTTTLATKAMEKNDGELLAIAATLAKVLYPPEKKVEIIAERPEEEKN